MIQDTSSQDTVVVTQPSRKKWVGVLAILLIVGVFGYFFLFSSSTAGLSSSRDSLKFSVVTKGELIRDIVTTGRIIASNAPQLYSPEQGYVLLKVKPGDSVEKGDIVAIVDSPELQNTMKQEQSALASLKSDLARQELDVRSHLNKQVLNQKLL